jgi:hypothetical protein
MHFKSTEIASGTRHASITISEMDHRAVAKVDCMMLERDASIAPPDEKMITACQVALTPQVSARLENPFETIRLEANSLGIVSLIPQ